LIEMERLRERWTVAVPMVAAVSGMAAPVAIYLASNELMRAEVERLLAVGGASGADDVGARLACE
jgi:Na+/H+ antiporter NhaA